jgi:7,8-dihydro-6-hydroxymethylpterin dimethyltransferase
MAQTSPQPVANRAICPQCNQVVPAHHETEGDRVLLVKECPICGTGKVVVSTNSLRYQEKRDMIGYAGEAQKTCNLECTGCKAHKPPSLVFIDVTNRCNMNCPICLANIPAMGFRFDPPMAYFEKIFEVLARRTPKPKIQLFGGEPTVRKDLIDIIRLAKKKYGLSARIVTNGLRLADEAYCKELVATGTQIMFSFDGRAPEIYERTRKHPEALAQKLRALENLERLRKSKVTIMCTLGEGVNDEHLADLIQFCHEKRNTIAALDMIPLTATWGPVQVDAKNTTIEDAERIAAKAMPGLEFFPAGAFYQLQALRQTFDLGRITFGGAHPNCEAVSILFSDGEKYSPATRYLRRPFAEFVADLIALDKRMQGRFERSIIARTFGLRGQRFLYGAALLGFARKHVNSREVFGGAALPRVARILGGLIFGKRAKDLLRAHTKCQSIMRLMILPFVEPQCVEAARLVDCPSAFAYEHPVTGEILFMPVCAWPIHKNGILRQTAKRYGERPGAAAQAAA